MRLAKSLPQYRDKSRLENNKLIINSIGYTLNELGKLPPDLAAYKAAEKSDSETIVFQGELSPWSNFHHAPFTINNQRFTTSEHWIQFQKALLFGDSVTANKILQCDSPYEAKKLGYGVQGLRIRKWHDEGYELCLEGVRAKFHQNPSLMQMLKSTKPKLVAEATTDRTWGTGIHLRDSNALDRKRWTSNGWSQTC